MVKKYRMANGTYGIIRPATIDINNDVEVWYTYRPSRTEVDESFGTDFLRLSAPDVLEPANVNDSSMSQNGLSTQLSGMYNLKLNVEIFNRRGIYTIYIRPKEHFLRIKDADATLESFSNVRGIVFAIEDSDNSAIMENGELTGYRVEYFDNNGERLQTYRIITSNNRVEPINTASSSSTQKSVRYRFNDNGNLVFCTLTPSSAMPEKPNSIPFIGSTNQQVALVGTSFNPTCIEVEMVDYDNDTLAMLLVGNQTRTLSDNIITTYNNNGEIIAQTQVGTIKDSYSNTDVAQFRENMGDNIDTTKDWNTIVGD